MNKEAESGSDKETSAKEAMAMTADTVGVDLLQALVQEIKLLPNVWAKISKKKQDEVINRLRQRVEDKVAMAIHLIASEGRSVIVGDVEQVVAKDGLKAVIKFSASAPCRHDLFDSQGQAVMVVIGAGVDRFTGGMDSIQGEDDQRAFDLGREYTDGDGMDGIIDAEVKTIENHPSNEEIQNAHIEGYQAAEDGQSLSDCPVMHGALCTSWTKGWKEFQQANNTEWWRDHGLDTEEPTV